MAGGFLWTEEIVDFVESGVSILVGTCDAARRPHGARGMGAVVSPARDVITVYLPEVVAARPLRNLAENDAIAVTFSRPSDLQGVQLKGRLCAARPATADERFVQERYRAAWMEQLHVVGVPRAAAKRFAHWPSVALVIEPHELFKQTPGPGAGASLALAGQGRA